MWNNDISSVFFIGIKSKKYEIEHHYISYSKLTVLYTFFQT